MVDDWCKPVLGCFLYGGDEKCRNGKWRTRQQAGKTTGPDEKTSCPDGPVVFQFSYLVLRFLVLRFSHHLWSARFCVRPWKLATWNEASESAAAAAAASSAGQELTQRMHIAHTVEQIGLSHVIHNIRISVRRAFTCCINSTSPCHTDDNSTSATRSRILQFF